ncbi:MAG: menaquinone biosynthesis decarboxylase [Bacteroidales bacterium]|nr:menaquinone biosynthesis decarboxylase [Bacteroidales bacterium]MCF8391984.1 menaquinone biosynthesis decarboxylase [Bacteroidales bacterium]
MAYKNLSAFIDVLKERNEVITVNSFVDPILEISEITDRFSKLHDGGKALLFLNTGTQFPVITNMLGSDKRMSLAMGVEKISEIEERLKELFNSIKEPRKGFFEKLAILPQLAKISAYFPTEFKGKADCQQVIHKNPDLSILPVLKTWPYDGGRFVTLPLVFTTDPVSGERNVGMYRMQIFDNNTTGMHWHRHKTGANHYEKYKKLGLKMPVAVVLGGDPAITYSATAPLPENVDELLLAGFLRQKGVPLVSSISQKISVPADAEIVIEGYVDPSEEKVIEGPFGDHTGFYSLEDFYPKFHVTCITHRRNAVYPATIVGIPPQEDAWIAKATERIFLMPIQQTIAPELVDMYIPEIGVAHNLTIVSFEKSYPGQARKIMNALWGAGQMMFNKVLIVTDHTVDIHNLKKVYEKLKMINILSDLVISSGPLDVLDHSSDYTGIGGKLGIDLTTKTEEELIVQPLPSKTERSANLTLSDIPEITDVRILESDNSFNKIALLNIKKQNDYKLSELSAKIHKINEIEHCNIILLTDENLDLKSFKEFLWYFLNNLEPERDILRINRIDNDPILIMDGTSKNLENDRFKRDWPNPVCMNEKTIKKIDANWESLQLGAFINSPSDHYNKLIKNPGARAYYNS